MSEAVRHGGEELSGRAMIPVATSLRWSRPDLTAGLAGHVADGALPADPGLWLLAAGWQVHGTAAVGDSRSAVAEALHALGPVAADLSGADVLRLVVEVASASEENGDTSVARRLAGSVLAGAEGSAELRLDARLVLVRCAIADRRDLADVDRLLEAARSDARVLPGSAPLAAVALAEAAAHQAAGRPRRAAETAAGGLDRLGAGPRPASSHLADSLTALRIGALLDLGDTAGAREVASGAAGRRPGAVPSRQAAQLLLVAARAAGGAADVTERALAEAADLADAVDVPGLAGACRVALGELAERQGRLEVALAAVRAGVTAQERDAQRGRTHRELVGAFEVALESARRTPSPVPRAATGSAAPSPPDRRRASTDAGAVPAGSLSAIDALLDGLDAGLLSAVGDIGTEPLAEPRPVLRRRRPEDNGVDAPPRDAAGGVAGSAVGGGPDDTGSPTAADGSRREDSGDGDAGAPPRPRRRAMATAVPIDGAPRPAGRGTSYGALLGDALITELRAAGRWSDEGDVTGSWPRLAPGAAIGVTDTADEGAAADTPADSVPSGAGRAARRRAREAAEAVEALDRAVPGESGLNAGEGEAGSSGARDAGSAVAEARLPDLVGSTGADDALATGEPSVTAGGATDEPSARAAEEPSETAREADDWLRAAIADLDRRWGVPERAPAGDGGVRAGGGAERAVGVSVVLDLVAGDRRIDSRTARGILRALTDRMRVHLPERARLRDVDPATLHVDLPGRDGAEVTDWLPPVLRDLAGSVTAADGLDEMRLRATVHDPAGAEPAVLVQGVGRDRRPRDGFRIEDLVVRPGSGGRRHRRAAADPDDPEEGDPSSAHGRAEPGPGTANGHRTAAEADGVSRNGRAARSAAGADGGPSRAGSAGGFAAEAGRDLGNGRRNAPVELATITGRDTGHGRGATPVEPAAVTDAGSGNARRVAPGNAAASDAASGNGRRAAAGEHGADPEAGTVNGRPAAQAPSAASADGGLTEGGDGTESLGLGDLLAGAMAAYRGL